MPHKAQQRGGPQAPSDRQIRALLRGFQPRPGPRFYRRMAGMPWAAGAASASRLQPLAGSVLAVLLVAFALLAISPVQTFAQEVLGFFTRAESDSISVTPPRGWRLPPPPSPTPLTVAQAEALAGFRARVPAGLPVGYRFEGAYYLTESRGVQLAYVSNNSALLTISQLPANRLPESPYLASVPEVGASAAIEIVRVGSVMGEYVRGGWAVAEKQIAAPEGESVRLHVVWDPDAAMQALRWQDGYVLYEIAVIGGEPGCKGHLTRDEIVMLAQSLQ